MYIWFIVIQYILVSPKCIENSGECLDVILFPEGFRNMHLFAKILCIIPCSMEVDCFWQLWWLNLLSVKETNYAPFYKM